ncbi:hypothetical protein [Paraburkholderia dinghuensis]|uniref:Uncharacterized protein n=1 Tax=Paraburkholderia dinghuensis TaxID=2305225 RepID=A0A3N6PSL7_9BURK|nr:hypothetical protein [Paraburkholderia dinghuensis]RQH04980.1 hypothetical protein D1Y85_16340 [Paraburkholderia dinghuensis]
MSDWDESKQPLAVDVADSGGVSGAFRADKKRDINACPNWAWATPQVQYDWMDSNTPFINIA